MKKIVVDNEEKTFELDIDDDLDIEVFNNANLTLKLLSSSPLENLKIQANLGENCQLQIFFADFSRSNLKLNSCVNLNGENANCLWHLACLASKKSHKEFDVSFIHNVGSTKALMDNYGVAKDEAKIFFSGINHIKQNSKKSITSQNAKIIVFDKLAHGVASPILKIDENEVQASHAAIVGRLNDDHMFYLMSRGLSKNDARELITRGYLEPIKKEFNEVNQNKIDELLKESNHV